MFKVALINTTHQMHIPVRADPGAAGYDLRSREFCHLEEMDMALIHTGIMIEIPPDCYARIAPRSGLSIQGIDVLAGVVDSSYRGEIKVMLVNLGIKTINIEKGDRIAQLIFERIYTPTLTQVSHEELSSSSRGESGFGSTGLR